MGKRKERNRRNAAKARKLELLDVDWEVGWTFHAQCLCIKLTFNISGNFTSVMKTYHFNFNVVHAVLMGCLQLFVFIGYYAFCISAQMYDFLVLRTPNRHMYSRIFVSILVLSGLGLFSAVFLKCSKNPEY